MAAASSSHSSITLRYLSVPKTQRPFFPHLRPNVILPLLPSPRLVVTYARRRNTAKSSIKSSKKKKKRLPRNDVAEEEDAEEDPFEALFSQLEEDLANDDPSLDDSDDDIGEEDLANLERELAEALEEDEKLGSFDSDEDDGVINGSEDDDYDYGDDDDDDDDDEEEVANLKNWQLRRLAYALKNGRRKTGIKNLAADICLDRAVVLKLLRDPPPNLLLLSATLPDKPISPILDPKSEPQEKVSSDAAADVEQPESKVKVPVHVMQSDWSARKRLKKVQVQTLERVYARTKRPSNAMVVSIVNVTNLPRKKVVKWFEDKRSEDGVPDNRLPYERFDSQEYTSGKRKEKKKWGRLRLGLPCNCDQSYILSQAESRTRSSNTFRREGSSGLVWDDKLLIEKMPEKGDYGELRHCQSTTQGIRVAGSKDIDLGGSNGASSFLPRSASTSVANLRSLKVFGFGFRGATTGKPPSGAKKSKSKY